MHYRSTLLLIRKRIFNEPFSGNCSAGDGLDIFFQRISPGIWQQKLSRTVKCHLYIFVTALEHVSVISPMDKEKWKHLFTHFVFDKPLTTVTQNKSEITGDWSDLWTYGGLEVTIMSLNERWRWTKQEAHEQSCICHRSDV